MTARAAQVSAAAVIAFAGAVALATSVRPAGLQLEWLYGGLAAVAGATLWSLATPGDAWFGDVTRHGPRPAAVRALVLLAAPLAGAGVIAYALMALYVTLASEPTAGRPVDWRRSVGTGFLGLAVVLIAVAAGVSVGSEGVLWSALLVGSGLALFWTAAGTLPAGDPDAWAEPGRVRTQIGLLLVVAGAGVILDRTGAFGLDMRTIVGAVAVVAVAALVILPRWQRGAKLLQAERRLRERERERAEIGEMLHDSVLQTLALIQRRDDVPDQVAALARRQERELRAWLLRGERASDAATSFGEAVRDAVAAVEDDHGVSVETVIVGDAPLSPPVHALVGATREALVNAARHGAEPISLFAKADGDELSVYVHDRGPGFDLEDVDPERRGVRESIIGRMERAGGRATIAATPGAGCEVILTVGGGG
jgi:signal transduction histidine kinase